VAWRRRGPPAVSTGHRGRRTRPVERSGAGTMPCAAAGRAEMAVAGRPTVGLGSRVVGVDRDVEVEGGDQVVSAGLHHLGPDQLAALGQAAAGTVGEDGDAVDLGGLALVATVEQPLVLGAGPIDEHLEGATDERGVLAGAELG